MMLTNSYVKSGMDIWCLHPPDLLSYGVQISFIIDLYNNINKHMGYILACDSALAKWQKHKKSLTRDIPQLAIKAIKSNIDLQNGSWIYRSWLHWLQPNIRFYGSLIKFGPNYLLDISQIRFVCKGHSLLLTLWPSISRPASRLTMLKVWLIDTPGIWWQQTKT